MIHLNKIKKPIFITLLVLSQITFVPNAYSYTSKAESSTMTYVNNFEAEFSKFISEFNLSESKDEYSHIFSTHINQTKEALEKRLERMENGKMASTYYDIKIANHSIVEIMKANSDKIKTWLGQEKRRKLYLTREFEEEVGFGYKKNQSDKITTKKATVVLVKDKTKPTGFKIINSYPMILKD